MSVENFNAPVLTDSGHLAGQLVFTNGGVEKHFPTVEARQQETREEVVKSAVVELTGETDADLAVADLYPGYADMDKRQKAAKLFVIGHKSVSEIAAQLDVPARTVSMWAYTNKWDDLLRKELVVEHSQSVLGLARLRNAHRESVAREQLEQAKKIREAAMAKIQSGETSIKSGAEAWAAAAKIEHTLTGMSEAGAITSVDGKSSEDSKDAKNNEKVPLVMIFQGNGLPPVKKSAETVINV